MNFEATAGDPIGDWQREIWDYELSKTQLSFKQEFNPWVTHKLIKAAETSYNPILQKYSDTHVETRATQGEHENFIDTLAKNKDRQLWYEQTFNIINFNDKL